MLTVLKNALGVTAGESMPIPRTVTIRAVFKKTFRDARRTTLWLGIGLGLYAVFIVSFYPAILKQADKMDELIQSYPKEMMTMFYGDNVENISVTEPGNFVQVEFATWMVLILGAILIGQTFNAFNNAERDGTMDVMMSLPVSRRELLLARIATTVATVLIVLTCCIVALVGSSLIWTEFDVPVERLALSMYGAFFLLMVVAGFTTMLATLVPSSRHFGGPVAYLFLFGSYLLHGFSNAVEPLKNIKPLLLFDYYNAGRIIREGADVGQWLILAAVALAYFGVAWWAIDRKELGV